MDASNALVHFRSLVRRPSVRRKQLGDSHFGLGTLHYILQCIGLYLPSSSWERVERALLESQSEVVEMPMSVVPLIERASPASSSPSAPYSSTMVSSSTSGAPSSSAIVSELKDANAAELSKLRNANQLLSKQSSYW